MEGINELVPYYVITFCRLPKAILLDAHRWFVFLYWDRRNLTTCGLDFVFVEIP